MIRSEVWYLNLYFVFCFLYSKRLDGSSEIESERARERERERERLCVCVFGEYSYSTYYYFYCMCVFVFFFFLLKKKKYEHNGIINKRQMISQGECCDLKGRFICSWSRE